MVADMWHTLVWFHQAQRDISEWSAVFKSTTLDRLCLARCVCGVPLFTHLQNMCVCMCVSVNFSKHQYHNSLAPLVCLWVLPDSFHTSVCAQLRCVLGLWALSYFKIHIKEISKYTHWLTQSLRNMDTHQHTFPPLCQSFQPSSPLDRMCFSHYHIDCT